MDDYHIIEYGYNDLDETINFGTRALADGDNLYEATTLATLRSESKASELPQVIAKIQNNQVYFSVNNRVRIFVDKECSGLVWEGAFDCFVDSFCVCGEAGLLLISLRNGTINVIDCNDQFQLKGSCSVSENNDHSNKIFINTFVEKPQQFLAVTSCGKVYRIKTQPNLNAEIIHDFKFSVNIASYSNMVLLVSGDKLAAWDMFEDIEVVDSWIDLGNVFGFNRIFMGIDSNGNLFKIDPKSLIIDPVCNENLYKQIVFIAAPNSNNRKQLIAVREKEEQMNYIELIDYPQFDTVYSLKLPSSEIFLITPESLEDEVLYIAKVPSSDDTELRFQKIYETEPEQRLYRLLKRQKFEEAEHFARTFKLNPQIINKYKAQAIVDRTICDSNDISKLIDLLDTIDDVEFKIKCCYDVEFSCEKFIDIKKILEYGCKLVPKSNHDNKHLIDELQTNVNYLMYRFETFMAIHSDGSIQDWIQFAGCDYIEELKGYLKDLHIDKAKTIYDRLDDVSIKKLNENEILNILDILKNLPIHVYQPFLATFIPITLQILPSTFSLFVEWIHSKVFHLEKNKKSEFPDNAIEFTDKITELMRIDSIFDMSIQRQFTLHKDGVDELTLLRTSLRSLKKLKDNYAISISVRSYLSGPQNVIRTLLNIELRLENYDTFLKEFLLKYMLENHLDPNEILLSEIIEVTKYEEKYWVHLVGSILSCMTSIPVKLEAVLKVLDCATVPWCNTIRNIANGSQSFNHPLVAKIKEMILDEPVQIILRKPKYRIRERRINDIYDLKFVTGRIIYCNQETMVDDVLQLCKNNPLFRHEANLMLIRHFIQIGNFEKALSILDNNSDEEILKCANILAIAIECSVDRKTANAEVNQNYITMAKPIFSRLIKLTKNEFEKRCQEERLSAILNASQLAKNFDVIVCPGDLRRISCRNNICDEILLNICTEFESNKPDIESVFLRLKQLARSLSLDVDDLVVKVCVKLEDFSVIYKSSLLVYETSESVKNLCLMAVLLLKYVGSYKIQFNSAEESVSDCDSFIDSDNMCDDNVFQKGLQLSEKLVAKALLLAEPKDLCACMEVVNWINISFYCIRDNNDERKKRIFGNVLEANAMMPGYLTFETLQKVFNLYCDYMVNFRNPHLNYLTYFSASSKINQQQLFSEIQTLPRRVDSLCKEGQHFTAFKICSVLQSALKCYDTAINPELFAFLSEIITRQAIPKLIQVVVNNSVIDVKLLYNLLISMDSNDAVKIAQTNLKIHKRHPKKLHWISDVAIKLWDHLKITKGRAVMDNAMLTVKWWKKFEKNRLNYDNFFKATASQRLEILMKCDNFDLESLKDYCINFELDLKSSLALYMKRILLNWTPDYEIVNVDNTRSLVLKNDEVSLHERCLEIIEILNDNDLVLDLISSMWTSVNNYHYEVFIAMLNILNQVDPNQNKNKQVLMLAFLKNYKRVSKPSEIEAEQWYSAFPDMQTLDPLSEFRLPFTQSLFTSSIWNIIRPEINLQTYKLWFSAIHINGYLNKDDICSYVAKEVIASGAISKSKDDPQWILYPKYDDLFIEVDECIQHISSLERATSVAYYIMSHTPSGADQVNAAKMAYKYAIEYRKSSPESPDIEKAYIKVERKYFSFAVMHILHSYQLAEDKYLNLVTQPKDLIVNLYQDDRILHKTDFMDLYCPDINKAVDAIAKLFGIDIEKIRVNLVNYWILDCPSSFDLDSSIVCPQNEQPDADTLKRAAYVCAYNNKDKWQNHLLKIGLDNESEEQKSVGCKIKALKLFAMISHVEEIVLQTETTYDEFLYYIDKLTIVCNLQRLGLVVDIGNLDEYNKRELLTRLVQRAGNLLAIKTMAIICMTYKMYDLKYWEFIVNCSIKFSMFTELKSYIYFLKNVKYHRKHFYINAWQKLIEYNFVTLTTYSESELDKILINNFLMIQTCPVIYSLNLENIFTRCINVGKTEFAAVLLQYMPNEVKDQCAKELINNYSLKTLGQKLEILAKVGIRGTANVQQLLLSL